MELGAECSLDGSDAQEEIQAGATDVEGKGTIMQPEALWEEVFYPGESERGEGKTSERGNGRSRPPQGAPRGQRQTQGGGSSRSQRQL